MHLDRCLLSHLGRIPLNRVSSCFAILPPRRPSATQCLVARSFAAASRNGRRGGRRRSRASSRKERLEKIMERQVERAEKKPASVTPVSGKKASDGAPARASSEQALTSLDLRGWLIRLLPVRYRATKRLTMSWDEALAMAQRLPLWLALAFVLLAWEETAPFSFVCIQGPSMLPTIAADGSSVWFRSTRVWRRRFGIDGSYAVGDLVGVTHPERPDVVSCKRIIGVAGDRVQRYGQYVHLYIDQDPNGWGIVWPRVGDARHDWIDRSCAWDSNHCVRDKQQETKRTVVVPPGHVWVEGDCPGLAVDSRQYGFVPVEWLSGKLVARLWPLSHRENWRRRPHPIPLDSESLAEHNVYRVDGNE